MTRSDRRKPLLIIQHTPYEHPAAIRRALETQGVQTEVLHPYDGEKYPSAKNIRGVISLGGPMSANDDADYPWLEKECALLSESVEENLPVVGICLGGQLLAKALGGRVERNPQPEIGWHPIHLTNEGELDRLFGSFGSEALVYHWHFDTFHIPKKATLLAGSKLCPRQAYRVGDRIYGFQFHPEVDHQLLGEWLKDEDVSKSILETSKKHGPEFVQPLKEQMKHAFEGEKAGLRIVAGIGQLFQLLPYRPSENTSLNEWRPQLNLWTQEQTPLELVFEGSDRKEHLLQGVSIGTISTPDGEFLILKEETTLLWPVRLDLVLSLRARWSALSRARKSVKSKSLLPLKRSKT